MASISIRRLPYGERWVLAWNSLRGCRAKKVFRTRPEAEAHLPLIDERPRKKSGPRNAGTPIADRIKAKVKIDENGCWVWQLRCHHKERYGIIAIDSKPKLVHRVSYETFVGPIPEGLQLDHLCRNRPCCNPAHLEPVTPRENIRRSPIHISVRQAAKTHCVHGHEFTPENTYRFTTGGKTQRACRTCARERYASKRGK